MRKQLIDANVPWPVPTNPREVQQLALCANEMYQMALANAEKRPKMTTLLEEFAEAVLASRGKHDDPLRLELMQIGSICINLLWQLDLYGEDQIANL